LNSGGALSSYPSGDTATYSIDSNCFLTVPRQTDNLGNVFEYNLGAVSPNGAVAEKVGAPKVTPAPGDER
jgi:hypothetical protein